LATAAVGALAVVMAETVTVNDVLDGHVGLDLECMDRIYLNGYVPNLQVSGQVASFMTAHLGYPIPSLAIMDKIGTAFRKAVDRFADDNKIPVARFGKDDREPHPRAGVLLGSQEHRRELLRHPDRGHPRPTGRRLPRQIRPHPIDLACVAP
jgi:hypothetical protein